LKECCVKLHTTFCHSNLLDVDLDDLFSKLWVLKFVLPTETMSTIDILKFVKFANCYPNVSIAYRDFNDNVYDCSINRKKILKIEVD
jgi:hypothetical protein